MAIHLNGDGRSVVVADRTCEVANRVGMTPVDGHGPGTQLDARRSTTAEWWFATAKWIGSRAAAVMVLVVLAACQPAAPSSAAGRTGAAAGPSPGSAATAPASSATSAPEPAGQAQAAAAAYRRYWQLSRVLDQRYAEPSWRRVLAAVAAEPVLSLVLARTAAQVRNRITLYGAVRPHPTITLQGSARAAVRDCQDASRAGQADAVTGQRRTVGVARNLVTAQLVRGADNRWRVSAVTFPDGSC